MGSSPTASTNFEYPTTLRHSAAEWFFNDDCNDFFPKLALVHESKESPSSRSGGDLDDDLIDEQCFYDSGFPAGCWMNRLHTPYRVGHNLSAAPFTPPVLPLLSLNHSNGPLIHIPTFLPANIEGVTV